MNNFHKNINFLKKSKINNYNCKIDIIYVLFFYKNIVSLIDQLINIYICNKDYNFRICIIINKNSPEKIEKKDLINLELPNYIMIGQRVFMHTWGSDILLNGFINCYNLYLKNLNFKYITCLGQNTYFIKKCDLSMIKEIPKKYKNLKAYECNKKINNSNLLFIYCKFFGTLFSKENINNISNYLLNTDFIINMKKLLKNKKINFPWETNILKMLEFITCDKTIKDCITKIYCNQDTSLSRSPTKDELKKDFNTFYEEISIINKRQIVGCRTYIFSIHSINIDANDEIKNLIKNLIKNKLNYHIINK